MTLTLVILGSSAFLGHQDPWLSVATLPQLWLYRITRLTPCARVSTPSMRTITYKHFGRDLALVALGQPQEQIGPILRVDGALLLAV